MSAAGSGESKRFICLSAVQQTIQEATDMGFTSLHFRFSRLFRAMLCSAACLAALSLVFDLLQAQSGSPAQVTIHKRFREVAANGTWALHEKTEKWNANQTAVIVCDVWDAHESLNAVRRLEEMAPRMNQVLENARSRGVLIVHAPSSCMERYQGHPARKRAQDAPRATNLPEAIGEWCRKI